MVAHDLHDHQLKKKRQQTEDPEPYSELRDSGAKKEPMKDSGAKDGPTKMAPVDHPKLGQNIGNWLSVQGAKKQGSSLKPPLSRPSRSFGKGDSKITTRPNNEFKTRQGDKVTSLVATLNVRGQTKMNQIKQIQIDDLIKTKNVILLQECHITDQTCESCPHIKLNFQIFKNNAESGYGTCSLVHNYLPVQNVKAIPGGRIIYFEIGKVSFCNVYLPSGSAGKVDRESIAGQDLAQCHARLMQVGHSSR